MQVRTEQPRRRRLDLGFARTFLESTISMMSVRALVRSARVPQHARVPLTRAVSAGPGSSWTWHEDGTNILRAIVEWGPGLTWRKLLHMKEIRFGNLVGVDKYGNHYYENLSYGYGLWCPCGGRLERGASSAGRAARSVGLGGSIWICGCYTGRHRWVEHAGLPRWSFVEVRPFVLRPHSRPSPHAGPRHAATARRMVEPTRFVVLPLAAANAGHVRLARLAALHDRRHGR